MKRYCEPNDASPESDGKAVGRRLSKVLDALDTINWSVVNNNGIGCCSYDCRMFQQAMIEKLEKDGWTVTVGRGDHWRVRP